MRLLFVADGRSPIALNWIDYFLQQDDEVHLVSTFPCAADPRLASFTFIPVAFSELKKTPSPSGTAALPPGEINLGCTGGPAAHAGAPVAGSADLEPGSPAPAYRVRPGAARPAARHAHPV